MEADRSSHRTFEEMAVAHVLGGLDASQGRLFRSHLLECADCRARVGELRAIAHDLAGVERDERRDRETKAVETKRREATEAEVTPRSADPGRASRWLILALVVVVVGLSAYTFLLQGNLNRAEQALAQRTTASAALEHGEPLAVGYRAPTVTATAKLNGEQIVVLLEGVPAGRAYGLYLVEGSGAGARTVFRQAVEVEQGRVFVLLERRPGAERLIVAEADGGFVPDGDRLLEVAVPPAPVEAISSG
jgi:hypothetical protein